MSAGRRRIRKSWYTHIMGCWSALNRGVFESVLMGWMNLEPITQNEVSQKEKEKYCILMLINRI